MASGSLHYLPYNIPPEKPAALTGLPAFPTFSSMIYAIMDEISLTLQAESVALVKYHSGRNEITLEMSRGDWGRLDGKRIALDEETLSLLTTLGSTNFNQTRLFHSFDAYAGPNQALYHSPLIMNGMVLGALWVGLPGPLAPDKANFLFSISDVLAHSLYSTRLDRPKDYIKDDSIHSLIKRLTTWDLSTLSHSIRMVPWAKYTALRLGCSEQDIHTICWATLLHDIGKICVPKSILQKPGPLNEEEWALMRLHPAIGARMISSMKRLASTGAIIETHHERFDGSGYPLGLKGSEIPLGARILAVADAYGSMTEDRVYKMTYNHKQATEEIIRCTGKHFDPDVTRAFMTVVRD